MARVLVGMLVFAMACDDTGSFDVVGESPLGEDTDGSSGGGGGNPGGGDPGGGNPGGGGGGGNTAVAWHHVVDQVDMLSEADGFDLDGDGAADNALGALNELAQGRLTGFITQDEGIVILQTWMDADVDAVGLLAGIDVDNDPDDNFSGSEVFSVASNQLAGSGKALAAAPVALDAQGAYNTRLPKGPLTLFGISLPAVTEIRWEGEVDADSHTVRFGTAVSLDPLAVVMEANGLGFLVNALNQFKDIDSDGNGQNDAVSVAFELSSVPCDVETSTAN